jgi:endo-1,4-beta-xylanase
VRIFTEFTAATLFASLSGFLAQQPATGLRPSRDWDKDKDGKISREEFKGPSALFEHFDANHDHFLSGPELAKLDGKFNLDQTADANWVVPPDSQYHGVEHKTYSSAVVRTNVGSNIYLPDDYRTSTRRYPVLYHLHGSGGNESSQVSLSGIYHQAIAEKKLPPVILVFVNGGKRSYCGDAAGGKIMAETTIIRELIPHVDATYRTIPDRECRVIHGFSMGGFGALKLGMKYPKLFSAALSFGGGMAAPDSPHMLFLRKISGNDDQLMAANNPADIATRNKEKLAGMSLWLFTGTRDIARPDSEWAHQFLQSNGIAHRFEVSENVGHALNAHYKFHAADIFKMLRGRFEGSKMFVRQSRMTKHAPRVGFSGRPFPSTFVNDLNSGTATTGANARAMQTFSERRNG